MKGCCCMPCHSWRIKDIIGLEAGIRASRQGLRREDFDLCLKAWIWTSRLVFVPQGMGVCLEAEILGLGLGLGPQCPNLDSPLEKAWSLILRQQSLIVQSMTIHRRCCFQRHNTTLRPPLKVQCKFKNETSPTGQRSVLSVSLRTEIFALNAWTDRQTAWILT